MPSSKQRTFTFGILAVLAVIAVAVVPELRHSPATLLSHAHKVAALEAWHDKPYNYFWLSNHEVLLIATAGRDIVNSQDTEAYHLNIQSGAVKEDKPLETALNKIGPDTIVSKWQLSPDFRWLLADDSYLQNTLPSLIATAVDGSKQIVRPRQQAGDEDSIFTVWQPDSKSWVQMLEQNNQVHTYSYRLDTPAIVAHVENTNLNGNVAVGFYSQDRLFCIRPKTGDGGGIGVMDLGIDASSAPVKNFIQNVPANMDVQEVALSPDRTQLAWKFTVKPLPLGVKATINSSYVRRSKPFKAGLWISDLNFNHLREIGTVDIRDDKISMVRWTSDGKSLSFVDDDTLYTVPVN